MPVQVAGGIRSLETVASWLESGADRVVLGTAALRDPHFAQEAVRRHGSSIVVSVDAREGYVAAEGWREETNQRAGDLLQRFAALGVRRFVYTDIAVDGTLEGPNYDAVADAVETIDQPIIAAGGVGTADHLVRLAALGVEGAIVGRALYDGSLTLAQAFSALAEPLEG
jgi:phosphoribosylformimino-5-aminoimidazole carboxamide ribotide isomerase